MKKLVIILMPVILFLSITGIVAEDASAQTEHAIPSRVEGTGTYFEITDSDYLNITLESSETIYLILESAPEMVTMQIEPVSSATVTEITLSGFLPLTTYYKYEDNYHNLVTFTTDDNGSYTYIQNISEPHFVFIQPRPSTKFIKDNSTGGDCTSIGIWSWGTKTCTLTTNVYETIQIDNNYITLDGSGYIISGSNTGFGVYVFEGTGIIVENLNINNFYVGICTFISTGITLTGNTASNNSHTGFGLCSASNSIFTGNTASNNYMGFHLEDAHNNTLNNNTSSDNTYGIYLLYSNNNNIYNNNFLNNSTQAYDYGSSGNMYNFNKPVGGNRWSDFDTPAEGCSDIDSDGFCDMPYYFTDGQDNLPLAKVSADCKTSVSVNPSKVWPEIPEKQRPSGYSEDWTKATVTVSLTNPAPSEGCEVKLSVKPVEDSGGHSHDSTRQEEGNKGTVTLDTISFAEGETEESVTYKSSEIAGVEKIKAEVNGDESEAIINVMVLGLTELLSGITYELIGTPDNHAGTNDPCRPIAPTSLHYENHHGTERLNTAVVNIADDYVSSYTDIKIRINDMSLPFGGGFDVGNHWTADIIDTDPTQPYCQNPYGHCSHRIGTNADIGFKGIDVNTLECVDLNLQRLYTIIQDNTPQDPLVEGDHYHIYASQ